MHSTYRTGWSTSRAKSVEPEVAERCRRLEWQVQKRRSTVHSTPRTGWSASRAKSVEPEVAERGRRLEWQVQKRGSTVHSTHRTGWSTSGAESPETKVTTSGRLSEWPTQKRARHPDVTSTMSKRAIARKSTTGAVTIPDIDGQKIPVKRNCSVKTEVQLSV